MFSQKLVDHLVGLEGRPWADCGRNGKALTQNGLARMLSKFEIKSSGTIRIDDKTGKGYELTAFKDAFERYLPPVPFSCGFGNARRGSREVKRSGTQRDPRATVQGGVFFPNRANSSGATNRPL